MGMPTRNASFTGPILFRRAIAMKTVHAASARAAVSMVINPFIARRSAHTARLSITSMSRNNIIYVPRAFARRLFQLRAVDRALGFLRAEESLGADARFADE